MSIGVTGHRNLNHSQIPIYEEKIFAKLEKLKQKYDTIILYSSLADGADRLAVKEALKLNINFIAVLPMPIEIYILDFDISSRNEFYFLLDNAKETIVLPFIDNPSIECVKNHGYERNLQYEQAGQYIADHSDILFALWDGKFNDLKGGTGEIVKYFRKLKNNLFHIQVERDVL